MTPPNVPGLCNFIARGPNGIERCILPPHHGTHRFPSGATCEHPTNTIRARIVVLDKESR